MVESRVQSHPWLCSKVPASLGYGKPYFRKQASKTKWQSLRNSGSGARQTKAHFYLEGLGKSLSLRLLASSMGWEALGGVVVSLGLALCVNEYSKTWNKLAVIEDMEPHIL